jgi:hypothetical protein
LLYDDFKAAVRAVCLPAGSAGGTLVPIPEVRRALADRVAAEEFDAHLCALQRDGFVHLLTHVEFDRLPAEERAACLRHPSGVVAYWVCWV